MAICGALFSGVMIGGMLGCGEGLESSSSSLSAWESAGSSLRLNHVQMKGTHNSYHIAHKVTIPQYQYTNAPLDVQLDQQGVRQLELDIHYSAAYDRFSVFHAPVIDTLTTCRMFTDCLKVTRAWSDAHLQHHPIVFLLEPKEFSSPTPPAEYLAALERDILSVWPRERLVTPGLVQGNYTSVAQALASEGWPLIDSIRGRALFVLHETGELRTEYTHGNQNLDGRIMFVESSPGEPFAGVAIINDPIGGADAIRVAASYGMLVRTRADSCCDQANDNDTSDRDAALAGAAHMISTDFPAPVEGQEYWVDIPGGTPSRCNPVTAPSGCTSEAIEYLP